MIICQQSDVQQAAHSNATSTSSSRETEGMAKLQCSINSDSSGKNLNSARVEDTIRKWKESNLSFNNLRAVYLFAGAKRKSEIGKMLRNTGWTIDEIDILRGGKEHDLTRPGIQQGILDKLRNSHYQLMLISPPCDSFTRVKFANTFGPRPVRSKEWPNGFPYLTWREKRTVQLADTLVSFSARSILEHIKQNNHMLVLEFPEDLGAVQHGPWKDTRPASIFQIKEYLDIMQSPGVMTGAILQSDFGMPYVKPTRLILRLHGETIRNFHHGMATFDGTGRYLGPAPRTTTGTGLAKTAKEQGFRTTGTAAWPRLLCEELVKAINTAVLKSGLHVNDLRQGGSSPNSSSTVQSNKAIQKENFPVEQPPAGYWIGGKGPPRVTKTLGKEEPFFDGCGLTSPGRWSRKDRHFPNDRRWQDLRLSLDRVIGNDDTILLKQFAVIACHREDLFCVNWVTETRRILHQWLGRQCGDYDSGNPPQIEEGQPFYLQLIHGLLREARDADFSLYSYLGSGVTLGVAEPLPHVPALYELQTNWRLNEDQIMMAALENSNYSSVEKFKDQVRAQFEEEQISGWMKCMSNAAFREMYKGRSAISALAVLQEKDKIRVLHDGSNETRVNHRIRCRDRQRMPTLREKRVLLNEYRRAGAIAVSILGDASKAHRRVKIKPEEWGFQACRVDEDTVWVNCVGTFGMSSASYWWGRVSGGIIRCIHLLNGYERMFDCLLFADDTEFLAMNKEEKKSIIRAVVALLALGWPFKWTKFRGGHEVEWVGYAIHYAEYKLGISASRSGWVCSWIDKLLNQRRVATTEMRCGLGRLAFVAQALTYEKPMLGVLYSWVATICSEGVLVADIPVAVQLLLFWIKRRMELEGGRLQRVCDEPANSTSADWFRTDARVAENRAYVGGWECRDAAGNAIDTKSAKWFAAEITQDLAPWVWAKKGDAQRVIAALELLGTILAIILFDPERKSGGLRNCSITGSTDNRGNSYIIKRMLSTKWPIMPLLIELSEQLRVRGVELHLRWLPRDDNTEADALSNLDFKDFTEERRIDFTLEKFPWIVFTELIEVTGKMYVETVKRREEAKVKKRKAGKVPCLRGNKKLKWTDPW